MSTRHLLLLAALISSAFGSISSSASAQTPTAFVAIRNLTVEGRDPPDYLRQTLDDNTAGVMRDFDVCYAERQALRADLAGTLSLRLWVSARMVIRVTPEANTLGDDALLACVKTRLLALQLPPDAPRAGATVRLDIVFTAPAAGQVVRCVDRSCSAVACGTLGAPCCPVAQCGGTGLVCTEAVCVEPPPVPPTFTATITRITGALPSEAVSAQFPTSALEACVTSAVTRAGNYSITISKKGTVSVATSRSMRPTSASTCVRNALRTMRFAAQPRSTSVRVTVDRAPTP